MISSGSDENPVEALAAEFIERGRRGERPTIEEYVARRPELAAEIRALFPTVAALEKVRVRHQRLVGDRTPPGGTKLSRLGDFRLIREIGRGGMGIVYEAVQESLLRRVAVKVLSRHSRLDESHRRRFLREARTVGRLHHTNIVPILGVGEHDGLDFFVMQYIDGVGLDWVIAQLRGKDLDDCSGQRLSWYWRRDESGSDGASATRNRPQRRLEHRSDHQLSGENDARDLRSAAVTRRLQPDDAARLLDQSSSDSQLAHGRSCQSYWQDVALVGLQAAQALEYAHGQGTLHRDIKPGNLLIDRHGTAWIADFGLAKGMEHDAVSRTGEVLGTLLYMAPEQWQGEADGRSDIYSLGVTLYELLTLRTPCGVADRIQAMRRSGSHREIAAPRKLCPAVPVDLETIVLKAMAEEPDRRYQTAAQLAADLERYLDDRPISVRRPTPWERWTRWRRRNPAAAVLSIVAALLAVLVGVVFSVADLRTRAALSRVSDANRETQAALTQQSAERQRAEAMLTTSLATLDKVFDHLVPDRIGATRALTVAREENGNLSGGSQPVVSPEMAALLDELSHVYDELSMGEKASERLGLESARATRRVGDIQSRLGNYERAATAYAQAIEKYQALSHGQPSERIALEIARLHNDLGATYEHEQRPDSSRAEFERALSMLQPAAGLPKSPECQFELARTHYLLGRGTSPDSTADPPPAGPPPGGPPPGGDQRPPGHDENDPPDSPRRFSGNAQELEQAIAILKPLVAQDPKNPAYRYLLAQCYREEPHRGPLPDVEKAELLLAELVRENPGVADYRYELADTDAMLDVRELPDADLPRAESRLRAALAQSADLADGHPYARDYAVLHIHILHKLAHVLAARRDDPGGRGGPARDEEAARLLEEAIRRQARPAETLSRQRGLPFLAGANSPLSGRSHVAPPSGP